MIMQIVPTVLGKLLLQVFSQRRKVHFTPLKIEFNVTVYTYFVFYGSFTVVIFSQC